MKRYLSPILTGFSGLLLAGLLLLAACSDELAETFPPTGNGVDPSQLLEVTVPFRLTPGFSAQVDARAVDQQGLDSQLSGIMVYVYENKGAADGTGEKLVAYRLYGKDMSVEGANGTFETVANDRTKGYFTLYLPKGDVYIYLIGNAKSSFTEDLFGQIQGDPSVNLATRKEFLETIVPQWSGNMYAINGFLPMAGKVNNPSGACKVIHDPHSTDPGKGVITYQKEGQTDPITLGEKGQSPTGGGSSAQGDHSFLLRRLMSKITMNFKSGATDITFTPKTYKFCHCREYIAPVWEFRNRPNYFPDRVRDTETVPFDAQTPNTFTVYLPENERICDHTLTSFAQRDLVVKDAGGQNTYETASGHESHYAFQYAPPLSTYVEITGKIENKTSADRSADVRYLIHLGNFGTQYGGRLNHFSLERDWHYTYNVTVNGANDIIVEVLGQNGQSPHEVNPAVEGVVFAGGARVELDAHFEQVEMHLQANDFTQGVYVYADTPFGNVYCKYLPSRTPGTPGRLDPDYPNSHSLEDAKALLQWIEFKRQDRQGRLAAYFTDANDPHPRMGPFDVLDYIYQDRSHEGYYTCFVDEYFYSAHPLGGSRTLQLSDFINAKDRTFSLGSDIRYSADRKSAVATAVYMLQQSSIACFYDLAENGRAKYGVELVDEIGQLPYGNNVPESGDVKNGRGNTWTEVQGSSDAVEWSRNGFLLNANGKYDSQANPNRLKRKEAQLACLARNRDFNGNGQIDNDELRWYTPARDQVLGLWIGEPAMPPSAALYPYPTDRIVKPNNGSAYPIYTSTNGQGRVVWAEEGGSFGDKNAAPSGGYVRVVRNLGTGNFNSPADPHLTPADAYYTYDATTRTVELHLTATALRAYSGRELAPHHERDIANRPYRKFKVAEHPYIAAEMTTEPCPTHQKTFGGIYDGGPSPGYFPLFTTPNTDAKDNTTTLAANYREAGDNATWRLPNQREMLLMIIAIPPAPDQPAFGYKMDDEQYHIMKYACSYSWGRHTWTPKPNEILHCRTRFSNTNPAYADFYGHGYMYNTDPSERKLQLMWITEQYGMENVGRGGYLCVHDVR